VPKRIRDRGIQWREIYREKSKTLKERYDREIGANSYFRWEGYDATSDSSYYVVLGPGFSKKEGKSFFSGIRKMPADYAPSGDYFPTMQAAAKYARDKWGVPAPVIPSYTKAHLANVHVPGEDTGKSKEPKEMEDKYQKAWDRVLYPKKRD